ncbi:MAG: gallidermin family lantibiotic [Saprospiraceae bacterium]|nr:gallidermin family lantibiotic [Saprospiraceae bacterium]
MSNDKTCPANHRVTSFFIAIPGCSKTGRDTF